MTDKPNHEDSHHHSPNVAIHQHASGAGHGHHVAHAHNSWNAEEYEQVLLLKISN